ncbi:hypothetical protein VOLCADRAFT_91376 [Volvox carteri f. nagariensis]|uniref:Regulator of chromosome condensation n=1 Tax=Volvox carteri f. nagariensis TaxID=3068 RepID=D8TWW8_VOLCA|nr:uncharacterized protein VOLCADRAFT_91376 [Volvox carteri f. nagariensis]EFJ48226.1 hypothetical protein VOLCADRAFT_91376 [Volvox carteri f. nagariensis]|eukprot:XP_002950911.1 hypothetical protein VOLCADRAFT_91376 [Volvox carteri f. nagariensis]
MASGFGAAQSYWESLSARGPSGVTDDYLFKTLVSIGIFRCPHYVVVSSELYNKSGIETGSLRTSLISASALFLSFGTSMNFPSEEVTSADSEDFGPLATFAADLGNAVMAAAASAVPPVAQDPTPIAAVPPPPLLVASSAHGAGGAERAPTAAASLPVQDVEENLYRIQHFCRRSNQDGQLGLGDNINRGTDPAQMGAALPFVDLGPGLAAVALAAGDAHTCAVLQPGGRVKCWGSNTAGQLGLGDNRTRGLRPTDMGAALPFVDLGPGLNATAIVAGSRHTCVLLQPGGRVKCWGSNFYGRLGLGDTRPQGLRPTDMGAALPFVDLGPGLNATALAAGTAHTCALLQPGSVLKCWGCRHRKRVKLQEPTWRAYHRSRG